MTDILMTDIMVDIETLATGPDAVILSIGACAFAPATYRRGTLTVPAVSAHDFYAVISPADQETMGRVVDPATVEWWSVQTEEARAVLAQAATAELQIRRALEVFTDWCLEHAPAKHIRLWGNGSDFDNVIISHAYKQCGLTPPWMFWNNRCFRSLKALGLQPVEYTNKREGLHHNALDDARYQARAASVILGYLKTMKTR